MQWNMQQDERSPARAPDAKLVPTNRARQGVTGHNVRWVLTLGTAGVIVAFAIIFLLYF
jgi:hypothetical protein